VAVTAGISLTSTQNRTRGNRKKATMDTSALDRLVAAHRYGSALIMLFDYDGTLAPIVEHAKLTTLPPRNPAGVGTANATRERRHRILRARTLDDLKAMLALPVYISPERMAGVDLCGTRIKHRTPIKCCLDGSPSCTS